MPRARHKFVVSLAGLLKNKGTFINNRSVKKKIEKRQSDKKNFFRIYKLKNNKDEEVICKSLFKESHSRDTVYGYGCIRSDF